MRKDWEVKTWNEVLSIINGKNQKHVEDSNGIYPIYGSGGIMGYANDFLCPNNTVIIGRKGNINKPIFVEEKFWNVDTAFGLVPKEGILVAKYLFYYCVNYDFEKLNKAVTIPSLTKSDLLNIKIALPPYLTQQQIVEELDCLTSIIEKQKKQLEELDKLAESIFYDMFGDPIVNEKGWNVKTMDNICNITSSKRIYSHEYVEAGIPFYRGKEITEKCKSLNLSVELFISVERYEELKENFGVPQIGDLLLTAVGTIGNIWIVDTETPFYFKDGNILWLKKLVNITPVFFKYLLELQISESKNKLANGCAYNALTIMNLKILSVITPPLPLQQQFASKIEAIEKQKELIKKSIKETEDLFNSRMDYYFN